MAAKTIKALKPETVEELKEEKPVKTSKKNKKGKVTNCELLNVRSEASIESSIIKAISVGTEVEILGDENDFYKITDGFVMKAYIAV